jgi:GAF domain-containing protein
MTQLRGHDLAVRMAELARLFAPPARLEEILAGVTSATVELVSGADMAGVLLTGRGEKFKTVVGTSELVRQLDAAQERFNEGPCVDAATDELVVRANDFARDQRWPNFGRVAIDLGVRSSLSFKLYGSKRTAGALNVFGMRPDVFTSEAEATGLVLASHAAVAILASRHGEQLESAVASRDTIGQAKGIIMERFKVDAVRAFDLLRKLSQTENMPLAAVAQRVIDSRAE